MAAQTLTHGYQTGRPAAEIAAELLDRPNAMLGSGRRQLLEGIARLLELGDPAGSPGLTTPALEALRRYFAEGGPENAEAESRQVERIIKRLFEAEHAPAYYERLAPLITSLAPLIARPVLARAQQMSYRVLVALTNAPAVAVAGPLRCWVDALSERYDEGHLAGLETDMLEELLAKYERNHEVAALAGAFGLRRRLASPGA